jgi:phage baseplate assembly protein gpV
VATVNASSSVQLATPLTHMTGAVQIDGGLSVNGASTLKNVTSNGKNVGSTHTHINSGGSGTGGVPS